MGNIYDEITEATATDSALRFFDGDEGDEWLIALDKIVALHWNGTELTVTTVSSVPPFRFRMRDRTTTGDIDGLINKFYRWTP